jgi:DNA topoisomerase-3
LPTGEKNILSLIAMKLVLATAEPHKYEAVKVVVSCENHAFKVTGKTIVEDGFKYIENHIKSKLKGDTVADEISENPLPKIKDGEIFENVSSDISEHFTSPPKSYTEDTLLSAMETAGNGEYDENADVDKKGLGTPATRANIIEVLIKRGFIKRDGRKIIADEKGVNLINILPEEIKSAKLTADWETKLQAIEKGELSDNEFMNDIISFVKELVSKYNSKAENSNFKSDKQEKISLGKCPRCGKNVYEGKISYYCESGKDGCGFTLWKEYKIPNTKLSSKQAVELLVNGKVKLKAVSKDGNNYTAYFKIEDTGKYINLQIVHEDKISVGKCIRCGKNIYEGEKGYYCESGKDGCGFILWKNQRYPETVVKLKNVQELLSDKKITKLAYKSKSGDIEKAFFTIEDTGSYINLKLTEK